RSDAAAAADLVGEKRPDRSCAVPAKFRDPADRVAWAAVERPGRSGLRRHRLRVRPGRADGVAGGIGVSRTVAGFSFIVIPGWSEGPYPESRDSGFALTRAPE